MFLFLFLARYMLYHAAAGNRGYCTECNIIPVTPRILLDSKLCTRPPMPGERRGKAFSAAAGHVYDVAAPHG